MRPLFNLYYLSLFQLPFTCSKIIHFMEDLSLITALNHKGSFGKHFVKSQKNNVICHPWLVRIMKNCAITVKYRHSFTRYGPPGRWITYLSLTCRRNTHIRTYPPTHTLSSFVVLCSKEHACTHWPPCNLWQGKIPLARLSQFQRARQKLWNVQFCSLFFQLQAMQKRTILEWSFFF